MILMMMTLAMVEFDREGWSGFPTISNRGFIKYLFIRIMILHFGNGQKGGVGKTFFIKMLIEYYLYKTWTYKLYDLDAGSLDVGKVYAPDIYAKKKKGDKTNDRAISF